jgi:hypothetical protein
MTRIPLTRSCWLLTFLVACAAFSACASRGQSPASEVANEVLVTLHNYKAKTQFELASESHTSRVEYYSDEREDAARKIQTDEVMSAFLREIDKLGLGTFARTGKAPSTTNGDVIRWGLEVASSGGREVHWLVGTGSSAEEWKKFDQCRDSFLQLYNSTVSYQSVHNQGGKSYFDDRARAASGKKRE